MLCLLHVRMHVHSYEPQDAPLYTNNVGESFRIEDILPARLFPHPAMLQQSVLRTALRQLGIRTSLQRHDILYAAKHMTSPSQAANLLAYLDSHFDRYFVDSTTVSVRVHVCGGRAGAFSRRSC